MEIIKRIKSYFKVEVIGSQLLVDAGLLSPEDTNDIDLLMNWDESKKVRQFLVDEGWKETSPPRETQSSYGGVEKIKGSLIFEHELYDRPIHVIAANATNDVWPMDKIIATKFERGEKSDLEQIIKACNAQLQGINKLASESKDED